MRKERLEPSRTMRAKSGGAWLLVTLVGLAAGFGAAPAAAQLVTAGQMAGIPRVSVSELRTHLEAGDAVIVDVRSREEYEAGHIQGALLAEDGALQTLLAELPADKPVITYCECEGESDSARVAVLLKQRGYEQVTTLKGGLEAWEVAGEKLETGGTEEPPSPENPG